MGVKGLCKPGGQAQLCIASEGRGIPETHQKWGGWWNKLYSHHLETLKSKDEEIHKNRFGANSALRWGEIRSAVPLSCLLDSGDLA